MPRILRLIGALSLVALMAAVSACGPAGPNDPQGVAADPVALLHVLPVPNGLANGEAEHSVSTAQVLEAVLPAHSPVSAALAKRAAGAGLGASGIRTFVVPRDRGTLTAVVVVWPSNLTANNFALQLVEQRLGHGGRTAWTPRDIPGSQGTRQPVGERERIVVRTIGPNALIVLGTGEVPDADVAVTLKRLVEVQSAKD